ncbi:MAG: L-fuculose-phosphate aldolase [Firmicutes bacterium]|nr:L-fuculose-phosphate aldolase [Bacillota bacterium]
MHKMNLEKEVYEARRNILSAGIDLLDKGLVAGTWGNISVKIPNSNWIAVTPSGRNYRTMREDDVVIVDQHGKTVASPLKPSSELPLHLAVYQARPDVQAIVHTHSIFASACAVARQDIPPIIEDLVQIVGGSVHVAQYGFPGTESLADYAVNGLGDKQAVLLANHGMIGCAPSLSEALMVCELVEKAASIYIYAQQLGGAQELAAEDVFRMRQFYLEHYRLRQGE